MRFYVYETEKYYRCTLELWNGLENRLEPDCLLDMEPGLHSYYNYDLDAVLLAEEDFDIVCSYWRSAAEFVNTENGHGYDDLPHFNQQEIDAGSKWIFTVSEESENS